MPEEGRRPHGDDGRSTTPDLTAGRSPMDDLGDIARELGFLPQRKSPPMAASTTSSSSPNPHDTRPSTAPPLFPDHNSGFPDDIFGPRPTNASSNDPAPPPLPVYDDDDGGYDIFRGIPGVKFGHASPFSSATDTNTHSSAPYEDLLGGFATEKPAVRVDNSRTGGDYSGLEDLLPGFGVANSENKGRNEENNDNMMPTFSLYSDNSKAAVSEDPFVFLESVTSSRYHSTESLDDKNDSSISDCRKTDSCSSRGEIFDEVDGFVNIELKSSGGEGEREDSMHASRASIETSYRNKESGSTLLDIPTSVSGSHVSANGSSFPDTSSEFMETNAHVGVSSTSNGIIENLEGIWLDVTEVPLFTQLTCSPPPSRPPPNPPLSNIAMNGEKESLHLDKNPPNSANDELEEFAFRSYSRSLGDGWSKMPTYKEDFEANHTTAAYAAAVKDDLCKMGKKSKHAKELMESETDSEAEKNRNSTQVSEDGKNNYDKYEKDNRNRRMQLERDQREKKVKEKARMKYEMDREDREKERRAVEIVTREARERAATDARLRAERATVEKASAEARERAEVEAREKALAEARERAEAREKVLAEARERTEIREKASAEAREMAAVKEREKLEKSAAEAKERVDRERRARERAAVERAVTEARIRAQAEAREKDAATDAAARERNQKNESFFGMNARPNSAPKQRTTWDPFDPQFQTNGSNAASNMRKASSTANVLDDLTSVFEDKFKTAASPSAFQEIDGEGEERRKARYDRYLRTCERTAKALAEKNERDIQTQKEQEERHRIADTLYVQIKRWACGKEGNLRALLSSLQYVLWPECGWQPVPLTDVITAASVKKVYRKATLCIHPDKVQQKGATLQQKYIAEKVFDLLKEAWSKFNSEELF